MKHVVDVQRLRMVEVKSGLLSHGRVAADVLIIGGSLGGVAATIAACEAGKTVCLAEETDWLGGQATSQGVSALDENAYIETSGGTREYLAFRQAIRDAYRQDTKLKAQAANDPYLNPGRGWVSRLCYEPRMAVKVIEKRLASFMTAGRLRILKRCKPYAVGRHGPRITHVDLIDLDSSHTWRATGEIVIDATELGDLLALGAADFVIGAEAKGRTNEPHAPDTADPEDVQSFTYPFAVEHRPGETHLIPKTANYDRNKAEQPYSLVVHYAAAGAVTYGMFKKEPRAFGPFWTYRRLIDAHLFEDPRYLQDIAMINWPGNDYRDGSILVDSPEEQIRQLQAAKDLSLGMLFWLQHEAPRDEGGLGYPEFKLRPDIMDTADGLSKFPYIRESRRIVAIKTILEQDLIAGIHKGPRSAHYPDSVGIGHYSIDLHESKRRRKQTFEAVRPFQIPLGALIPQGTINLLAACKNIGTTHITNGCYREHPTEWAIGEAAGTTAALCVEQQTSPARLRDEPAGLLTLQGLLVRRGAPLFWYDDLPIHDPRFQQVQLLPFEKPEKLESLNRDLHAPS